MSTATNWKFTSEERNVVYRINEDGCMESCFASREDVQAWVAAGGVIGEPEAVIGPEAEAEAEAQGSAGTALGG